MAQASQAKDTTQSAKKNAEAKRTSQSSGPVAETAGPLSLQAALADPLSASPAQVLQLQRQYGSRAVQRLIQRAQAEKIQSEAAVGLEGGAVEGDLQNQINSARGSGQPLDRTIGSKIGGALGADFSEVKIHTDSMSDNLNRSLSAKAFTLGSDVFFSKGAYNPGTHSGKQLLAHELTHVVQQGASQTNKVQTKLTVGPAGDKYEQEADRVADSITKFGNNPSGCAGENELPPIRHSIARQTSIQRLVYSDPPATWTPVTKIKRSGEGVQGVFFVSKGDDKIVVKPEADDLGNVEFANRFLTQGMGLESPNIKSYPKASTGGAAIANILTTNPVEGARTDTEVQDQLNNANHIAVMSIVQGKSIQSLDDTEAEEFVTNATSLQQVGRLMVSDAFLGNRDRLVGGNVNLGNFFYQTATLLGAATGQVATIDNASGFKKYELTQRGNLGGDLDSKRNLIEQLIDPANRLGWINAFYTKLRTTYRDKPNTTAAIDKDFIVANVSAGIDAGLRDMADVFTNNMALVQQLHGIRSEYGRTKTKNYGAAKGLAKYIKSRMTGGDDPAAATAKLKTYVEYRARRRTAPRGFKWVTKLFSRTGF